MEKLGRTKVITVTQQDIDAGIKQDACRCPVARATCRAFKKKLGTFKLAGGEVYNNKKIHVAMPPTVKSFIGKFDSTTIYHPVQPFTFTLEY